MIRDRVAARRRSRAGRRVAGRAGDHVRRVVDEVVGRGLDRRSARSTTTTSPTSCEDALIPRFARGAAGAAGRQPAAGGRRATAPTTALVDLALDEAHGWLVENPDTFAEVLEQRAPWWAPPWLNDAVTRRLHAEALGWLAEIRDDPHHHARQALDDC